MSERALSRKITTISASFFLYLILSSNGLSVTKHSISVKISL